MERHKAGEGTGSVGVVGVGLAKVTLGQILEERLSVDGYISMI